MWTSRVSQALSSGRTPSRGSARRNNAAVRGRRGGGGRVKGRGRRQSCCHLACRDWTSLRPGTLILTFLQALFASSVPPRRKKRVQGHRWGPKDNHPRPKVLNVTERAFDRAALVFDPATFTSRRSQGAACRVRLFSSPPISSSSSFSARDSRSTASARQRPPSNAHC